MISNLKMGNNFFEKEKKIQKLTEENQQMKTDLEVIQQENSNLKNMSNTYEKKINELTSNNKIKEIEYESLTLKFNRLKQDYENLNGKFDKMTNCNTSNVDKVKSLNDEIDSLQGSIQIYQNLEIRLRKEIESLEDKSIGLERKVENLNETLEERNKKIEILEKSLEQKNRHISVLVKERDRVGGVSTGMNNKENALNKINDEKSEVKSGFKPSVLTKKKVEVNDDKGIVAGLEGQIKEKDKELEKLKKENFLLSTRLRNTKAK